MDDIQKAAETCNRYYDELYCMLSLVKEVEADPIRKTLYITATLRIYEIIRGVLTLSFAKSEDVYKTLLDEYEWEPLIIDFIKE